MVPARSTSTACSTRALTEFTTDPRCYYDAATNTWFATILFISADFTTARLDIAVNTSGDPTEPWTHTRSTPPIGGRPARHPGCPCFGDQPLLGIDQHNLYVTTNEFSILGPEFNGAQIYAIAKSDLVAGPAATGALRPLRQPEHRRRARRVDRSPRSPTGARARSTS